MAQECKGNVIESIKMFGAAYSMFQSLLSGIHLKKKELHTDVDLP
ncbi:hypothetical protein EYZ11_002041 [Aspergillus tanneri]|uniref:Uncharacterized protein n=1 Tax=Aspergillus tanneri TaxID=1220188 RepID=A0A4S3JRW7_9EURO|nr:hypothetical protein EYZ11_002041 [Aspergillus tanneri]